MSKASMAAQISDNQGKITALVPTLSTPGKVTKDNRKKRDKYSKSHADQEGASANEMEAGPGDSPKGRGMKGYLAEKAAKVAMRTKRKPVHPQQQQASSAAGTGSGFDVVLSPQPTPTLDPIAQHEMGQPHRSVSPLPQIPLPQNHTFFNENDDKLLPNLPPDEEDKEPSKEVALLKLSRISSYILKEAERYSELKGTTVENPVHAVRLVLDKYKALEKHLREINETSKILATTNVKLQSTEADLSTFKDLLKNCERRLSEVTRENEDRKAREGNWLAEKSQLEYLRSSLLSTEHMLTELRKENEGRKKREENWLAEKRTLDYYRNELTKTSRENDERKIKESRMEAEKASMMEAHAAEKQGIFGKHAEEVRVLKSQISGLQYDRQNLINSHEAEVNRIRDGNQVEISRIVANHSAEVQQLKNDIRTERWEAREQLKQATESLKNSFANERQGWNQRLNDARLQHQNDLRVEEEKHEAEAVKQQKEIERLKFELEQQEIRLKKQYEAQSLKLRADYERLKGDYVAREHFKGLTDMELSSRFQKLAFQIEQFSKIRWDLSKETSWPLPDRMLLQFHPENPRKLKQQIVQNCMWVILCDEIFGSPFAILGEEGERLDENWTREFGSDKSSRAPSWPRPTAASEKKRYELAKAIFDVMDRGGQVSELDKQPRDIFNQSVTNIVDEITVAVEKVAPLGLKELQTLRDLVSLAGKLWLETCSQRYRTLFVLPNGSEDILTSTKSYHREIRLVLRPELRRFGNSQGQELTKEEIVSGWKCVDQVYEL